MRKTLLNEIREVKCFVKHYMKIENLENYRQKLTIITVTIKSCYNYDNIFYIYDLEYTVYECKNNILLIVNINKQNFAIHFS